MKHFGSKLQAAVKGVVAFLAVCAGTAVQSSISDRHDLVFERFDYGAIAPEIGEISNMRATLADDLNGRASSGKWLVVEFDRKADSATALRAEIETPAGALFAPVPSMLINCGRGYPGLTEGCTLAFEVPTDLSVADASASHLRLVKLNSKMSPRAVLPLEEVTEQTHLLREGVKT